MSIRAALAAGTLAVVLLAATGCSMTSTTRPLPAIAAVCSNLLRVADAAADPERTGDRTTFGSSPNLLGASFLYGTSWNVQLSALRHRYPTRLDKHATERWLLHQIAAAQSAPIAQQGASIDSIRDAVLGLVALGDAREVKGDPFARFRSGWGYASSPGQSPDAGSSDIAAESLITLGLKPPSSVIEHVSATAARVSAGDSLTTVVDNDLDAIQIVAAGDSPRQLLRIVPRLASDLRRWNQRFIASGPGGVQLSFLLALHRVANRIGLRLASPPSSWLTTLRAPGGFLALGKGGQGDPQVTYDAMKLGLLPTSTPLPALDAGVTPSGWLVASRPTLESFYDISALHQICKSPLTDERRQLAHWTESVLGESKPTSQSLYEVCALRVIYRSPLTKSVQGRLARHARTGLVTARADATVAPHALAEAYIAAKVCGARAALSELPAVAYTGGSSTSSLDAFGAFILDGAASGGPYSGAITHFLRTARRGWDYRYNSSEPGPDVYSTGLALDILGASAQARAKALDVFRSQGSWAVQQPDRQNPDPGATLGSLLAVAFLVSGTDSIDLSPLFIT